MEKKQLKIDGRLSQASKLTFMEIKLMLSLLLRYFTRLDKTLSKKGPKQADSKGLIAKLQEDLKDENLSPAKIERHIRKLEKLKAANTNQGDTKALSASNKKILEHMNAILALLCNQAPGYMVANKKTVKVVTRKKRGKTPRPLVPGFSNRLDNIVLVIGHMEAEGGHQITASSISEVMQVKIIDEGQNSNANVRACLRQHRIACQKEGKNYLVGFNPSAGNHEYFLTEEGKKRFQELFS
jgi:hypothetical protein